MHEDRTAKRQRFKNVSQKFSFIFIFGALFAEFTQKRAEIAKIMCKISVLRTASFLRESQGGLVLP
jgi:hypothetical protein